MSIRVASSSTVITATAPASAIPVLIPLMIHLSSTQKVAGKKWVTKLPWH